MTSGNFALAALKALSQGLKGLQGLSAEELGYVSGALSYGAHFAIEFGPTPAFESTRLVLVEPDDARTTLTSISINGLNGTATAQSVREK
jgi:hypothetical protein